MNTHHIKYFCDAYRLNSVFQAANMNHVASSTISQSISTLENELGYRLTRKTKGLLNFTDEGVAFAERAVEILKLLENLKADPLNAGQDITGRLRIATHQSFLHSYLWMPIREYKKLYPKVEVQISTGIGSRISDLLDEQQIDLAVTLDQIRIFKGQKLYSETLLKGDFKLIGSSRFKLTQETPGIVTNRYKPEISKLIEMAPWLKIESQLPNWTTIQKVIQEEPLLGYLPDYLLQSATKENNYREPKFAVSLRQPYEVRIWYNQQMKNNTLFQNFLRVARKGQ